VEIFRVVPGSPMDGFRHNELWGLGQRARKLAFFVACGRLHIGSVRQA